MLPQELQDDIESFLCNYFEDSLQITSAESVSGGSINQTFKLSTKNGCFFLKFNEANRYPRMFESESKGLALLADTKTLRIPKVLTTGETQNYTYLLMEYIEPSSAFPDFWEYFGQQLAALHQTGNEYFGLDHDNYMGSLLQSNIAHDDWVDFFIEERLEKQVKLAKDENRINSKLIQRFDKLYVKLSTYFPPEPPSLIHGDLW
jgi:fructosamine-3-kinase